MTMDLLLFHSLLSVQVVYVAICCSGWFFSIELLDPELNYKLELIGFSLCTLKCDLFVNLCL